MAYALFTKKKDTTAYITTQNIMLLICLFRFPLRSYIYIIAITAMQLQSDGKVIRLISMRSRYFCHCLILFVEWNIHRETIAQNKGQITLV